MLSDGGQIQRMYDFIERLNVAPIQPNPISSPQTISHTPASWGRSPTGIPPVSVVKPDTHPGENLFICRTIRPHKETQSVGQPPCGFWGPNRIQLVAKLPLRWRRVARFHEIPSAPDPAREGRALYLPAPIWSQLRPLSKKWDQGRVRVWG